MNSLPPVPRPAAQRWRDFRLRGVPVIMVLLVAAGVALLWNQTWSPSLLVGEVQAIVQAVNSPRPGMVLELRVDQFDHVTNGQFLARVQINSPETFQAELAVIRADLETLRERMILDQQRDDLNYHQSRMGLLVQKIELATAKVRLQQAQSEYERVRQLYEQQIVPAGIGSNRDEFGLDVALRDRDALQQEVEDKTRLVAEMEQAFQTFKPPTDPRDNPAITRSIAAAITAQEERLRQTSDSVVLKATMDGAVTRVIRRPGENVVAGELLVEICGEKPGWIIGFLRQPIPYEPKVGDPIEVRARSAHRRTGLAKVMKVGARLELFTQPLRIRGFAAAQERGLPVLVTLPAGISLHPGELVDLVPLRR